MSKTLDAVKLCLNKQRDANKEYKRMCAEFPKVEKERDKARQAVAELTERLSKAECQAEEARQTAKQADKKRDSMSKSLESIKLVLQTRRTANTEHKRMSIEFPKVEKERDKARQAVTELTERLRHVEYQLAEVRKRAQDAAKEVASMVKSKEKTDKLCAQLRRGQATYRKLQSMMTTRDNALVKVSLLQERCEIYERDLKLAKQTEKKAREEAQRAQDTEQALRKLERHLLENSKKHKWMLVASALGMDSTQTKRLEYIAKHMHDTKSEDWQHSLMKKSDLTTRLPTAVRLLLKEIFSCVRVQKKTVAVTDILRHVYKQEICEKVQTDTALKEIRNAVRSAVRIV